MEAKTELNSFSCPSRPNQATPSATFSDKGLSDSKLADNQQYGVRLTVQQHIQEVLQRLELSQEYLIEAKQLPDSVSELLNMENELLSSLSTHLEHQKGDVSNSFEQLKQTVNERIDAKRDMLLHRLDEQLRVVETKFATLKRSVEKTESTYQMPNSASTTKEMNQLQNSTDLQKPFGSPTIDMVESQKLSSLKKGEPSTGMLNSAKRITEDIHNLKEIKPLPAIRYPSFFNEVRKKWTEGVGSLLDSLDMGINDPISEDVGSGGLFSGSKILTNTSEKELLKNWLPDGAEVTSSLLYRGSRDGFGAANFHQKCDDQGRNIVVVETTAGVKIGGYCPIGWQKAVIGGYGSMYVGAKDPFLFSITNAEKLLSMSPNHPNSIGFSPSHGPIFGGGMDLCIADNCNTTSSSQTNGGHTYQLLRNRGYLAGAPNFTVKEIEVYALKP